MGFIGSIPVAGPVAVVVVKSALDHRERDGLWIAVGAAIAESLYALVAFWGMATLFARYPLVLPVSRIVGGMVLVLVGLYFLVRGSKADAPAKEKSGAGRDRGRLFFGFSITALNPTLAATWTTAVGALHSAFAPGAFTALDALPFAGGVGAGIVGWFWLLLRVVRHFGKKLRPGGVSVLVRALGGVLMVLGALLASRTLLGRT